LATYGGLELARRTSIAGSVVPDDQRISLACALAAAALTATGVFRAIVVGQCLFKRVSILDIARATTVVGAIALAAMFSSTIGNVSVHSLVYGNVVGGSIGALYYFVATRAVPRIDSETARGSALGESARYAAPTYIGGLVQFLNYRVDVFLVAGLKGAAAVGTYQLAVMIAESLRVLPSATQAVIWPTIAAKQHEAVENAQLATRTARIVFFLTLLAAAAVAIVAWVALNSVFGPAFAASLPALLLLLPGITLFSLTTVLAGYLAGMGAPRLNLYASAAGLVATIALDFTLIPRYGIVGAAIASTVSYAVTTGITIAMFAGKTSVRVSDLFVPQIADLQLARRLTVDLSSRLRRRTAPAS
jgi:O-antigen/teichoic acid export membrane protein